MLSCEFIQWRGELAARRDAIFWRRCHVLSWPFLCPLQSLLSDQTFMGEEAMKAGSTHCCAPSCLWIAPLVAKAVLVLLLCLVHEEWTAIRWVGWWKIGVVCYCGSLGELDALSLFQQRGRGEPQQGALCSSPKDAKQEQGQLGPRLTKLASKTARSTKLWQFSQGIAY